MMVLKNHLSFKFLTIKQEIDKNFCKKTFDFSKKTKVLNTLKNKQYYLALRWQNKNQ